MNSRVIVVPILLRKTVRNFPFDAAWFNTGSSVVRPVGPPVEAFGHLQSKHGTTLKAHTVPTLNAWLTELLVIRSTAWSARISQITTPKDHGSPGLIPSMATTASLGGHPQHCHTAVARKAGNSCRSAENWIVLLFQFLGFPRFQLAFARSLARQPAMSRSRLEWL